MKCPYCNSNDTVEYGYEADIIYNFTVIIYRCYNCGQDFEERNIKGCGKQIFRYGDNYPVFNKGEDKMKFNRGNKVRIKMDTGIYYEGEIVKVLYFNNLYKVKYFDGYKYIEDTFKPEELELIPDEKEKDIPICPKCINNNKVEVSLSGLYKWYCRHCNFWFNPIQKQIKQNCQAMAQLAQKSRIQFKDKGIVPKAKKDDLINLWIDLWELLKDKINGKKEIKK